MGKILNENISPSCSYCKHGRVSPDGEMVLCVKKGFMRTDSYCKTFKYDPLKRVPKRRPGIYTGHTKDEFDL